MMCVFSFRSLLMLWNRKYQEFDLVVSSVTAKVKGVAQARLPGGGDVVWDVVDYSGPSQDKNSFFVMTNVIVTKNQKQGKCPEVPVNGRVCKTDGDCERGATDQQSHGIQTGSCVKFDVLKKTCEVAAWCPIETKTKPPRPALLEAAENFTVLIKNNIRFPAFNFIRRNILPEMNAAYLSSCQRGTDSLCPIFRLGDVVKEAGETFSDMAVEGGVIGILIKWDCDLDRLSRRCLPRYSFRRLDEKESNRTLYPGINFRFAKYNMVNGAEERTLYKAFGIRFDVMVFGQAGRFSFIQLIVYIGSTLSYYALEDSGHLRAVLCLLQSDRDAPPPLGRDAPPPLGPEPKRHRPAWCRCDRCAPSSVPQEELCCRRSDGACITSSPLFERLVLRRPLLEAALAYRDPLSPPPAETAALRHCAYAQYVSWRLGVPPADAHPVIPSCCVRRVRDEYPSPDGRYVEQLLMENDGPE
uniref:P2X purinoceptor n=1 Tax=Scophthalmus maximus TaxID=52904 RepID=A0A8D3C726_SCOMX